MKPVLFLVSRPGGVVADNELSELRAFGGLGERELVPFHMEQPAPRSRLDDYSAVIISGSPYNILTAPEAKPPTQVRTEEVLADLCDEILARDFPTLGICFGMQMLAKRAGGTLTRDYPERISAPYIELTEEGRRDPLISGVPSIFQSYAGHGEAVGLVPDIGTVLASSALVPVQILRLGKNVYGTQFHPEISREGIQVRIEAYGGSYFAADQRNQVLDECLSAYTDHTIISRFIDQYRS
ncbi:MAG: gamma-glutamyl-gamma-aminobutyrate hydrolase family protein [Flaviflexus sp.]|uniref:glutamine amidotransferase-related protein n=1 Tax=Flaviflexus sp. TaxID=1969482 RepID=UPI00352BFCF5